MNKKFIEYLSEIGGQTPEKIIMPPCSGEVKKENNDEDMNLGDFILYFNLFISYTYLL